MQSQLASPQAFETWFRPIVARELTPERVDLEVPNAFFVDWIHEHYLTKLRAALSETLGSCPDVHFSAREPVPVPPHAGSRNAPYVPRAGRARDAGARARVARQPAAPAADVRDVRGRRQQSLHARRGHGRVAASGRGLQSAVHLWRFRPRQDAHPARRRPRGEAAAAGCARVLRVGRALHQRDDLRHPARRDAGVPQQVPHRGRAAGGRRAVPGRQAEHAGGVLPHLQRAARRPQADRGHRRQAAQGHRRHGGAAHLALQPGPGRRHAAAGSRNAHRHPAQPLRAGIRAACGSRTTSCC